MNINECIDLNTLSKAKPLQTSYEIELFPNAKFKLNGYCFTISHKGSIFGTGFRSQKTIRKQLKKLLKEINGFTKDKINKNCNGAEESL